MRVAVVDDLRMDAENLRGMLDRRLPSGTFIDLYESGEAFLASQSRYDLIFLDIVMEGMDGIETARQFRARDMDCLIVFLTSSREYVWEAFPMHAFDYLVKPVEQERLDRVLEEAQRALACQERMLSLKVGRQRITVPVSSLRHANARDHFVFVTLTDGRELKCYMTFGEMLAMLEGEPRFLVCNRGVLINMDQVRSFDGECFTMNGGQRFAVRLSEKTQIGRSFYQYTFRKTRGVE